MNLAELNKVAEAMVAPGKGILAADESSGTIKKRFDPIGVESTEDNRRDYRELLFRSKNAMTKNISGVILYDETFWQKAKDGTPLVKLIEQAGSIPGIKVDEGTQPLPGCPGELITVGLDKLAERLKKYYEQGARFAKWRAVIDIAPGPDSVAELTAAVRAAKAATGPTVIQIHNDPYVYAPEGDGWWDVPVAEVSTIDSTTTARADYLDQQKAQRPLLG